MNGFYYRKLGIDKILYFNSNGGKLVPVQFVHIKKNSIKWKTAILK